MSGTKALDCVLGALDEEVAIMVSVDAETIKKARAEFAQLKELAKYTTTKWVIKLSNDLAQLRAALDEARKAMEIAKTNLTTPFSDGKPVVIAAALLALDTWLEAHPEEKRG